MPQGHPPESPGFCAPLRLILVSSPPVTQKTMLFSLALASSLIASVAAHATFQELWINGVDQGMLHVSWLTFLDAANSLHC